MSSQPRLHAVKGDQWVGSPTVLPLPPFRRPSPKLRLLQEARTRRGRVQLSRPQKARADRSLPTDRLSFDKQVDVLRAIAQMSGSNRRPVTAEDLSASIGLRGNTGGLSNKFFRDSGWVVSAGRGMYTATDPLLEYHRHLNVDPQDMGGARRHLAGAARDSWYWEVVEQLLDGGARQTMILHALSKAAGAYDHMPQLQLILTWLEWLGLVRREGDLVLMGNAEVGPSDLGTAIRVLRWCKRMPLLKRLRWMSPTRG